MQKQKRSNRLLRSFSVSVIITSVLFAIAFQILPAQVSYAQTSPDSAIPVTTPTPAADPNDAGLRAACAEAVEELKAARRLINAQGLQIDKFGELVGLERQLSTGLKNLRTLDAQEKDELRNAIAAANREVAAVKSANQVLKKNQVTFWKQFKWVVIGGAAGIVVGSIVKK